MIVDTHLKAILESPELYRAAKTVVVIDHHRKCVGHIDDSVVFYTNLMLPAASELVSELLQYIDMTKENRLTPGQFGRRRHCWQASCWTRAISSLHTGVRTFEAAAYLRRMGAQTQAVKKLFNSSFESYAYKAQLVTDAEIYMAVPSCFPTACPRSSAS